MPYLTAPDGVRLYHVDKGAGSTIVLIHGWTVNHTCFARNIDALAEHHRVLAVDMRAHGYSGMQETNWTLGQVAADIGQLLDHVDVTDATLVGWSMGATAVFNYFARFGAARVRRAVIVDMTPHLLREGDWPHALYGTLDRHGVIKLARNIVETRMTVQDALVRACFSNGRAPDDDVVAAWINESLRPPDSAMLAFLFAMAAYDWRGCLADLPVPVLLCYGAHSAVYPTDLRHWMAAAIPDSTLVTFEHSGHAPFWEEPDKFNDVVSRFASTGRVSAAGA